MKGNFVSIILFDPISVVKENVFSLTGDLQELYLDREN